MAVVERRKCAPIRHRNAAFSPSQSLRQAANVSRETFHERWLQQARAAKRAAQ
jgi:hypothetical protein